MKMPLNNFVFCSFVVLFSCSLSAQTLTAKQKEREKNKVEIYSAEERDNLQRYYHEEVKKMNLSEKEESNYYETLVSYTYDMARLNDKDKGLNSEEIKTKLDGLVTKMNSEMKSMLSTEQYIIHLETFNKVLTSIYHKQNWDKN